jgi:Rps23 Pro-64 3,4-dihydroxylase Tpa1-like proline 4-hydroxylase
MNYTLWKTNLLIEENFFANNIHRQFVEYDSLQSTTVKGMDSEEFAKQFSSELNLIEAVMFNYAIDMGIDPSNVELSNIQFGKLTKYNKDHVGSHLYEPHHDMVEQSIISAIYYIDSDYSDDGAWVGGELCLYNELTFASYPTNSVNILPKSNRLVMFPGFLTHRVKPYFGERPRRTIVFGWKVKNQPCHAPTVI